MTNLTRQRPIAEALRCIWSNNTKRSILYIYFTFLFFLSALAWSVVFIILEKTPCYTGKVAKAKLEALFDNAWYQPGKSPDLSMLDDGLFPLHVRCVHSWEVHLYITPTTQPSAPLKVRARYNADVRI